VKFAFLPNPYHYGFQKKVYYPQKDKNTPSSTLFDFVSHVYYIPFQKIFQVFFSKNQYIFIKNQKFNYKANYLLFVVKKGLAKTKTILEWIFAKPFLRLYRIP